MLLLLRKTERNIGETLYMRSPSDIGSIGIHNGASTEREHIMLPRILIALLLFAAPVYAFAFDTAKLGQLGSIALDMDEIHKVIVQSPKLAREIDEALAKINKKPADVTCDGMRFPGSWKELRGLHVSPYRCQFGDKWLKIRTKVVVTGKGHKIYDTINQEAMRRAEDVVESDPDWTWSATEPPQP